VSIPEGSSSPDSQQVFGPPAIEGAAGTKVGWVNFDFAQMSVLADDYSDPGFFNATHHDGSDNPTAGSSLYYYENFYYTFTTLLPSRGHTATTAVFTRGCTAA